MKSKSYYDTEEVVKVAEAKISSMHKRVDEHAKLFKGFEAETKHHIEKSFDRLKGIENKKLSDSMLGCEVKLVEKGLGEKMKKLKEYNKKFKRMKKINKDFIKNLSSKSKKIISKLKSKNLDISDLEKSIDKIENMVNKKDINIQKTIESISSLTKTIGDCYVKSSYLKLPLLMRSAYKTANKLLDNIDKLKKIVDSKPSIIKGSEDYKNLSISLDLLKKINFSVNNHDKFTPLFNNSSKVITNELKPNNNLKEIKNLGSVKKLL